MQPKNKSLNEDHDDGYTKCGLGMISWKECCIIVQTSDIWLKKLKIEISTLSENSVEITDEILKLWSLLKELWALLHYTSDDIKNSLDNNFTKEREFFKNFGETYYNTFGAKHCVSHYLHIVLCHTIPVSLLIHYCKLY